MKLEHNFIRIQKKQKSMNNNKSGESGQPIKSQHQPREEKQKE